MSRIIPFAVGLILAFSLSGCGGHKTYSATGSLTWTGGRPGAAPMPGQGIRLTVRAADGRPVATAVSDRRGAFRFKLRGGHYTLAFEPGRGCPSTMPLDVPGPAVMVDCPRR